MLPFTGLKEEDDIKGSRSSEVRVDEEGKVYRKGFKKFPNGDIYEGEFVGGRKNREGQGRMTYTNGNVYVGRFVKDLFDGFGLFVWAPFEIGNCLVKGKRYEGNWAKGKMNGHGSLWVGNGDFYEGNFQNNQFYGQGSLRTAAGALMKGTWQRSRLYGDACSVVFSNRDRYEGGMWCSHFHGKGTYTWGRGLGSYEGECRWGQRHGRGHRVYANGTRYEGMFKDGEPNGEGVMTYCNGDQYVGDWKDGRGHGKGVMVFGNGDRYDGEFLSGVFYGHGKYTWSDGGWYEGDYLAKLPYKEEWDHKIEYPCKNGKRCGKGVRVWATGNKYEGDWDDDLMNGNGIWTSTEGHRYEGQFLNGLKHGEGELIIRNKFGSIFVCLVGLRHSRVGQCTYKGSFCRGEFHGKGTYICIDGRRYDGDWKMGKRHGNGTQILMGPKERGDPNRMFIGGEGALYRPFKYSGEWKDNERHGSGTLEFENGDLLIGKFVRGHCHGKAVYVFGRTFTFKVGIWKMGTREAWENTEASLTSEPSKDYLKPFGLLFDKNSTPNTN